MSHISPRGESSTSAENAILTALTNLSVSGASQAIQKTGASSFANVSVGTGSGSLALYDEGVLLGNVTSLNVTGSLLATILGQVGTIDFTSVTSGWSTVLSAGNTTNGVNPLITSTDKIFFTNVNKYIWRPTNASLDIVSDTGMNLLAPSGELNLKSTTLGFFSVTAVARQTLGAALTNSVTVGGTTNTVADFNVALERAAGGSDTVDITDVPSLSDVESQMETIRNNMYQLARQLKIATDALRAYGLLT